MEEGDSWLTAACGQGTLLAAEGPLTKGHRVLTQGVGSPAHVTAVDPVFLSHRGRGREQNILLADFRSDLRRE